MAFDRGQHVGEAAKDVRAYRLALIGTGHRKDLVGRNTEVIRPKPNKALDEADLRGDGGFDADFGLVLNKLSRQRRRLVPAESEPVPAWEPAHRRSVSSHYRRPCQQQCPWPLPPSWRAAPTFPSLAVQRGTRRRHAPPARCWAGSPPQRDRRWAVRGRPAMRRADRPRSRRSNRRPVRNRT